MNYKATRWFHSSKPQRVSFFKKTGMLRFFIQKTHLYILIDTMLNFHRLKGRSGIIDKHSGFRLTILLILCADLLMTSSLWLANSVSLQPFLVYCFYRFINCWSCIKVISLHM